MFESICNMIYNFIFYTPNDEVETRRIIKYPDPNVTYPTLIFEEKYFINHRNIKLYYQKYYPKYKYKHISKAPDFDVLSDDPYTTATIVKERLHDIVIKCKIIKRKGVVQVICENPKHKQRQG